ncbi:MAG TPA: hypothetical protein VL495_00970 [Edaphobacter sp.]|nr:hypothetical protein [Edaphobacter sp.]
MAVHSPHCDLCDGPTFVGALQQQSLAQHSHSAAPDACNGVCWCCGFHSLPGAGFALKPADKVNAGTWPEPALPGFTPRMSIFRPPRVNVSV